MSTLFWWHIIHCARHGHRPFKIGKLMVDLATRLARQLDGLFGQPAHSRDALLRATRPQAFGLFWRLCALQWLLPALCVVMPSWLSGNALQPGELLTFSFWLSALGVAPATWWGARVVQQLRPTHLRVSGDALAHATHAAAQLDRTWASAIGMSTTYMLITTLWTTTFNVHGMAVALQIALIAPSFVLMRVMPERGFDLFNGENIVMTVAAFLALPALMIPSIAPERTEWLLLGPLSSVVIAWFTRWSWFKHLQRASLNRSLPFKGEAS